MALAQSLRDNFNDNTLNTSLWLDGSFGTGSISETGQAIVCTPPIVGGSAGGILKSVSNYDLTSSYAYVQVVQVCSTSTNAKTMLRGEVAS